MPRGQRKPKEFKTTEQKLADIISEIQTAEKHLASLKLSKKELEKALEQEKIEALLLSIKGKNISLDEAKTIIDNLNEQ